MLKGLNIVFVFLFAVAFISTDYVTALSAAEKAKSSVQTICPVMGGEINKNIYSDYKGFRIYHCCSACPGEFKKNPEKYMKKLKDSGVIPEKTPAK